ncbi:DUF5403 family protein [Streptomyces sp. NPDC088768]|uniref:DUF5403 family protein n=1 Tax=Streptomyces sp. NPDC088768 TaxID=3365894 RepID=UPI00381AC96B
MATVKPNLGRKLASLPGVNDAVRAEAERRADLIRAAAASHRRTGAFARSITVVRANGPHRRQDYLIAISHPWTIAINWGHHNGETFVRGIHVIERGLE